MAQSRQGQGILELDLPSVDPSRGARARAHETPEQTIDRVVDAFDRRLADRAPDGVRGSDPLDVVRTACEVKAM
jgi:hypothetical protein